MLQKRIEKFGRRKPFLAACGETIALLDARRRDRVQGFKAQKV